MEETVSNWSTIDVAQWLLLALKNFPPGLPDTLTETALYERAEETQWMPPSLIRHSRYAAEKFATRKTPRDNARIFTITVGKKACKKTNKHLQVSTRGSRNTFRGNACKSSGIIVKFLASVNHHGRLRIYRQLRSRVRSDRSRRGERWRTST